jgi:UDP-2,3-diacylglucosamine hydrolase
LADLTFISDLHIGPRNAEVEAQFLKLLAELARRAGAGRPQQLYVLGDLFAFWVERPRLVRRLYSRAFGALGQLVRAGCPAAVLDGNRDFGYGPVFSAATGATPLGERAVLERGGGKVLLLHGDELLTADRRYQFFKRIVRSLPARAAARWLPEWLLLWMIGRLEGLSRHEKELKPPAVMEPDPAEAGRLAAAAGAATLVCGHTHAAGERRIPVAGGELRMFVLGSWTAEGGTILDWPEGGAPQLVAWPGGNPPAARES